MNKEIKIRKFLSYALVLHAAQNIVGPLIIISLGYNLDNLILLPFELFGGVFSLVCASLITKRTTLATWAVFLRALGGIFSASMLHTSSGEGSVLRIWPILIFLFILVFLFKNRKERLEKEEPFVRRLLIIFIILMFINWFFSSSWVVLFPLFVGSSTGSL